MNLYELICHTENSTDNKLSPADQSLIIKAVMQRPKEGLLITDHSGTVMLVNRAAEQLYNINASQVVGCNVSQLAKSGILNQTLVQRVINNKRAVNVIQSTDTNKTIFTTAFPVFDKAEALRFVIINDRDVSLLRHLIEAVESDETGQKASRLEYDDHEFDVGIMEGMVVRCPAMYEVLRFAVRAARYDIPLVLTGESGVGKSMIAQLVHRLSNRRQSPFVHLNCGAIAGNLLESELFGHEQGAFTGAAAKGKQGLFETADNGTLFLDEIGEVPLNLQVKLLKFLETHEILRVGGIKPIKINTRIIAATNRDLEDMVQKGSFRADLFFRLNVVPTHVPALRDRREEIKPLVAMFLKRFNKEFKTKKTMSDAVLDALNDYDFPGNVRELENLIKRLIAMSEGNSIRIKHLPRALRRDFVDQRILKGDALTDYQQKVAAFEKKIIMDAIQKYGSQRKAADALGLNQSTLSRKIKK